MRRDVITLLLVTLILSIIVAAGCSEDSGPKELRGILNDFNIDPPTVIIDDKEYPAAEGMVQFAERAEKGAEYFFTIDEFGSVIKMTPVK